jgi:hypothetical protein
MDVYLKYFHDGKNIEKMLQLIESENAKADAGEVSSEHIDELRRGNTFNS